jgi:hypothetical protein
MPLTKKSDPAKKSNPTKNQIKTKNQIQQNIKSNEKSNQNKTKDQIQQTSPSKRLHPNPCNPMQSDETGVPISPTHSPRRALLRAFSRSWASW